MGYVNYIYLTICETSLKLYAQTSYKTYPEYCKAMARSIDYKQFSKVEIRHLIAITEKINIVYSLPKEETGKYIKEFFESDRVVDFQTSVLMTKKFFKHTGD